MSHHEVHNDNQISQEDMDSNSRADALAMLALVAIVVCMMVFFVSR